MRMMTTNPEKGKNLCKCPQKKKRFSPIINAYLPDFFWAEKKICYVIIKFVLIMYCVLSKCPVLTEKIRRQFMKLMVLIQAFKNKNLQFLKKNLNKSLKKLYDLRTLSKEIIYLTMVVKRWSYGHQSQKDQKMLLHLSSIHS